MTVRAYNSSHEVVRKLLELVDSIEAGDIVLQNVDIKIDTSFSPTPYASSHINIDLTAFIPKGEGLNVLSHITK